IYGTEFNAANRGSFPILNVVTAAATQYFEVSLAGSGQVVTQLAASSVMYFRPTRKTAFSSSAQSTTVSLSPSGVTVILPATSPAVSRGPKVAAYGQLNPPKAITSLVRVNGVVTVTVPNHGLSVGNQFLIDGEVGGTASPAITAG